MQTSAVCPEQFRGRGTPRPSPTPVKAITTSQQQLIIFHVEEISSSYWLLIEILRAQIIIIHFSTLPQEIEIVNKCDGTRQFVYHFFLRRRTVRRVLIASFLFYSAGFAQFI